MHIRGLASFVAMLLATAVPLALVGHNQINDAASSLKITACIV